MNPVFIPEPYKPVDFSDYLLDYSDPSGFVAYGANLLPDTLLNAYSMGLFPWYISGGAPCWYSPDPRLVLFPHKLRISKSMRNILKRSQYEVTCDRAFARVMMGCALTPRHGELDTWIDHQFLAGYNRMHQLGHAHSFETWKKDELVGGLYGIAIGKVFFGESMFSKESNTSKIAFIHAVRFLLLMGFEMIDCQIKTDHLVSLGAEEISREHFMIRLFNYTKQAGLPVRSWYPEFENIKNN